MWFLWVIGVLVALVVLVAIAAAIGHFRRLTLEKRARAEFPQQREQLQQQFFAAASASGKPKGLRWKECQWEDWVEFVRHRNTGELAALVSLTIHFEAIEGGDMEGVAAVGLPRNASAVFFYRGRRWQTDGRAVFNHNPDEAAEHFRGQYERIEGDRSPNQGVN